MVRGTKARLKDILLESRLVLLWGRKGKSCHSCPLNLMELSQMSAEAKFDHALVEGCWGIESHLKDWHKVIPRANKEKIGLEPKYLRTQQCL